MVMISFESLALWSLHIIRLLWGWTRGEQSIEGRVGEEGELGVGGGGRCTVKAAEQKEKTINSSLVCLCVFACMSYKTGGLVSF